MKLTWGHCPHCGVDAEHHIRSVWDYQSEFDVDCPRCGKAFGVEVQSVPEFICTAETVAEQDRKAWERSRAVKGATE